MTMTQPQPLQFSEVRPTTAQAYSAGCSAFFRKTAKGIHILAVETYTTLRHVLPSTVAWIWRKYAYSEITTMRIRAEKTGHVAYLNLHGTLSSGQHGHAVLLIHGDYGHPFSMLHLADIAQTKRLPTFSLYLPKVQDTQQFEVHNELMKQAMDNMETMIRHKGGTCTGILGAGHSSGAILLAKRRFVDLDNRITLFAIAGPLNVPNDNDCSDKYLAPIIKGIYQGIVDHPNAPLVQIIPREDWNASQESMAVRPHSHCHYVPGMHLSGLYSRETQGYFTDFLDAFASR